MFERIAIDAGVCGGQARIRGTRITVAFILKLVGAGRTPEQIVTDYPELHYADVHEAADYGAWLASEKTLEPASIAA